MSSQQGIGRASSAESSPRKFRVKKSPHGESKELVLVPMAARPTSNSHSALQSAWIQRIIPLSSRGFGHVSQDHPALFLKNEEASKHVDRFIVNMDYDDEDCERDVSGFKFHAPSSWLTVKNLEREEIEVFPVGEMGESSPKLLHSTGSQGKVSLSSDSKVVPVMEDEVAGDLEPVEQTRATSSAWFARIAKKNFGETKQAIRTFPPLKSGEQWPGTLKPSGLPPLRILSSKNPGRPEEIPLLTPVNAPGSPEIEETGDDKDIPSGMKTISLKDSVDASGSLTCSLPSNFVMDRNDSDRTRSLQDNFGFFNGVVKPSRKSSNASSSSDTKSLFDEEGEEVQSFSRQEKQNLSNNEDDLIFGDFNEKLNRSKCNYQNETKKPQYLNVLRDENHRKSSQAQRSPGAQQSFNPQRGEQIPLAFQLGSQQWLQRWCSSSNARTLNP